MLKTIKMNSILKRAGEEVAWPLPILQNTSQQLEEHHNNNSNAYVLKKI